VFLETVLETQGKVSNEEETATTPGSSDDDIVDKTDNLPIVKEYGQEWIQER
jgi:hypothetical protein